MTAIGIDYTPAHEQGAGIGRYVRELVSALARLDANSDYRLFVAGVNPVHLPPLMGANFHWCPPRLSPRGLARLWHRLRVPLPVEAWTGALALFHATDFVLPPVRNARTLLTIHDLSFVLVPESASPRLKRYLDRVVPQSIARADHLLADSAATKQDLISLYQVDPDKITVLLSGVSAHFRPITDPAALARVRSKYGLDEWSFLFTVGTVQPRKNYERLCEALASLRAGHPDLHLVIAGGKGWMDDPIYAAVEKLNLKERVYFIGYAADEDLPALYSMASAVPFVSLYEGFGFPVLEAMACGTPVVASNISSIPEVAGSAALLVNPRDTLEIVSALENALDDTDLRADLRTRGLEQASRFTWERSARHLLEIYQGLAQPV
jgi:glycosyltransferase involved in cell wall biosynthesis